MKTLTKYFLILLSIITIQSCSKGVKTSSTATEPDSTASYEANTDETVASNKDYSYYESKGYQVFSQANLAIKPPCRLNDVSSQASGDFLLNYGGVENENDAVTFAAYQLIVTRFPVSYSHFSEDKKQSFREKIFSSAIKGIDNYKRVKVGHEGYEGIIIESTKNGYSLKGETFIKDDYVYGLVVISNDNLESRFNQYTNSIRFISESMEQKKKDGLSGLRSLKSFKEVKPIQTNTQIPDLTPEQYAGINKQGILNTPLKEYVGTSEIGQSADVN